ncbi:MAG: hypothetical protein M1820_005315 [Bogoriella megaspora]|nr:MAG: hypothetical protein M1820_005315 [Bogoriella megaspora]
MAANRKEEAQVYLAFRSIFTGEHSKLRKSPKIRQLILNHQDDKEVRPLILKYGPDQLRTIVNALLEQDFFGSTSKAKNRFPEAFPSGSAKRLASVDNTVRTSNEFDAITHAAKDYQAKLTGATSDAPWQESVGGVSLRFKDTDPPARKRKRDYSEAFPQSSARSLYPIYLPMKSQHRLLSSIQFTLEEACYNFGRKVMGIELEQRGWDSPECAELNTWAQLFAGNKEKFIPIKPGVLGMPLQDLFQTVMQLRHTTVHRHRVTANQVESFMIAAEQLAMLLGDEVKAQALARLRREARPIIDELEHNKDLLESKLAEKLEDIASQRVELDRLERGIIEEILEEDKDYQNFAGASLEKAMEDSERSTQSDRNYGGENVEEATAPSEHFAQNDQDAAEASLEGALATSGHFAQNYPTLARANVGEATATPEHLTQNDQNAAGASLDEALATLGQLAQNYQTLAGPDMEEATATTSGHLLEGITLSENETGSKEVTSTMGQGETIAISENTAQNTAISGNEMDWETDAGSERVD